MRLPCLGLPWIGLPFLGALLAFSFTFDSVCERMNINGMPVASSLMSIGLEVGTTVLAGTTGPIGPVGPILVGFSDLVVALVVVVPFDMEPEVRLCGLIPSSPVSTVVSMSVVAFQIDASGSVEIGCRVEGPLEAWGWA